MLLLWPALLFLLSLIFTTVPPNTGEYYLSSFFTLNYQKAGYMIFFLVALIMGLYTKVKPVLAGLTVMLFFALISIYEATRFRTSHNLIPFEFIFFAVFSLPVVAGVFIGNLVRYFQGKK